MAYNTAVGRAEYTATAGQTVFTFNFKIISMKLKKADLSINMVIVAAIAIIVL